MEERKPSQPVHTTQVEGMDVMVPMRDGTRLAVDIYRPGAEGRFPALLSFAAHNKFLQSLDAVEACNNQPAWAPLWCGAAEAGDTRFLTARGYAASSVIRGASATPIQGIDGRKGEWTPTI